VEHRNSPESEKKNVSRAAGVVGFYTFLSRILGLVRDMVIASLFGSGMAADAFFVALRIPNLLRRLFAEGSLTIAFIPVFTEYLTNKTKKDAFDLARIVLTLLTLTLVIVTVLGILFSPWIVRIQAFGFGSSGVKYDLTVLLTRITFPSAGCRTYFSECGHYWGRVLHFSPFARSHCGGGYWGYNRRHSSSGFADPLGH